MIAVETWRMVPSSADQYEVSDLGRVRRKHAYQRFPAGYLLTPHLNAAGRPTVSLKVDGRTRHIAIHQLVMAAFVGPTPPGMEINHIDGDKTNNRPSNLEFLSPRDNIRHAMERGLWCKGEKVGTSKLTIEQVEEVFRLHDEGLSNVKIAQRFGVSNNHIWRILNGFAWKHVRTTGETRQGLEARVKQLEHQLAQVEQERDDARADVAKVVKQMHWLAHDGQDLIDERDALKAQLAALTTQLERHRDQHTHRWNTKVVDGALLVCQGDHHRSADCEWETFVPADQLAALPTQGGDGTKREWQPIETAPKNATEMLLWGKTGGALKESCFVGHWACDLSGEDQPAFRGWFTRHGGNNYFSQCHPTHWLPLPKAPAPGDAPNV